MTVIDDAGATSVVHTACTLDCPDACSLAVTITTTAAGRRITGIDASPDNTFTDGWICAKVKRHAQRVYAPERVLTPLVRTGAKGSGEFREATWQEALDLVAERMHSAIERTGPEAMVAFTYNSSAAVLERSSFTEAFFAATGATIVEHTICAATMGAAWDSVYGDMESADPREVVHSKLVVIWGANPTVSNTHFPPLVRQAAKAGAKVVVIDPRATAMAARADLHLAIRPGTDVVLAMAIANHWAANGHLDQQFIAAHADGAAAFLAAAGEWTIERAAEVTGLAAPDITTLAEWWGTTRATMLRIGWGRSATPTAARRAGPSSPCRCWAGTSCTAAAASSAPPRLVPPGRARAGRKRRSRGRRAGRCRCTRSGSGWRRARPTRARCCSCRGPTRW